MELTVLVIPVTSKFLDSIHNSSGSQELHGGGRVHCPSTCSSGGVLPQRRVKQNTKAQEGREVAAKLSGKQAPFFLEQEPGSSQKSSRPVMPSQLWFSTRLSSLSWLVRSNIRQWVSGRWLTTGGSGAAWPEQRSLHQETVESWEKLWVRGAHSQAFVPSRPWSSRVWEPQESGQMGPCGAGDCFAVPGTLRAQSCHQPAAQGWEAGLPFQKDLLSCLDPKST